ncbi:MAG: hypothetical protein R3241_05325 [Rheinheimera sp.]|nr:hypothetical protein [Rheinheimera sp.]
MAIIKKTVLLLVISVFAAKVQAATLLTDANLDQFEALLPKLQQLQQRPQNSQFNLQQHCNWSQHYTTLSAQETDSDYRLAIERIAGQHGFTPVQFIELSAKLSWPVLDSVQGALEVSRQALLFLPAQQRQSTERKLIKGQQYYKTLTSCLTADDKTALAKHHNRIMQIAKRLGGVEQLLPGNFALPGQ